MNAAKKAIQIPAPLVQDSLYFRYLRTFDDLIPSDSKGRALIPSSEPRTRKSPTPKKIPKPQTLKTQKIPKPQTLKTPKIPKQNSLSPKPKSP